MTRASGRLLALSCVALFAAAGCTAKNKTVLRHKPLGADDALSPGMRDDPGEAPGVDVTEANIRGSEFARVAELQSVHFEYDSYELDEKSRTSLQHNAAYLKGHPGMEVLVAGHCDERGTIHYNLALGQQRARAVREYYMRLGVPGRTVATISYGEEQPVCREAEDPCWRRNRRAETRIRARTVSSPQDPEPTATP